MTIYSAPSTETRSLWALWFGLLAGPLIWSVYFMAGYALVEFACKLGLLRFNLLGLSAVSAIIIGLTLVALLATLYAGFVAYQKWQRMRRDESDQVDRGRAEKSPMFMALAGVLLSGLFALLILLTGIPALVLRPC
jgi:hypothetical protein